MSWLTEQLRLAAGLHYRQCRSCRMWRWTWGDAVYCRSCAHAGAEEREARAWLASLRIEGEGERVIELRHRLYRGGRHARRRAR